MSNRCFILMHKHYEVFNGDRWVFDESEQPEERYIDLEEFHKITSPETLKFFRCLGGTEELYKKDGLIVKLTSTRPDGMKRSIYRFQYIDTK